MTDSDFVYFGLVDENNMLTNAGVLLADESPIRHSRLFCTRWYGLDKASGIMEALDDKEYSGSLMSLLQNGTEFVKNNTKKRCFVVLVYSSRVQFVRIIGFSLFLCQTDTPSKSPAP